MLRKALLVVSGNALASILSLVRNLIIARMIPLEDFGIAATFMILVSIVEMVSTFGLQQQIVQARDGDDPRLQAALQGFHVFRGALAALAILALAGPIARFMNLPEVAWAYQLLALVPLLNSLQSFDIYRFTRQMRFGPMLLTGVVPGAMALVMIWPLTAWTDGYRVMLYSILIQWFVALIMSHLVAERAYRLSFDSAMIRRSLAFGWPLMVNSLLLFGVFNGDRIIVGRELGPAELAIFSMGMTLTLTPTLILARSMQNLFLPKISEIDRGAPGGEARFTRFAAVVIEAHMLIGLILTVGAVLFGPFLVDLLLGEKYAALSGFIVWFAAMQGLRIFKGGPSVIAVARGRTENAMIANIVRVALLPLAWWVAIRTGSFEGVILVAIAGETVGCIVSFLVLRWRINLGLSSFVLPGLLSLSCIGLAISMRGHDGIGGPIWIAILCLASFAAMRQLPSYVKGLFRS